LLLDLKIVIFQTVRNGLALALHSVVVDIHDLDELLKRNITHIVLLVGKEAS